MPLFATLSPHMSQTLDLYLNGALVCMAGGLVLLIVAVVVFKRSNRKKK